MSSPATGSGNSRGGSPASPGFLARADTWGRRCENLLLVIVLFAMIFLAAAQVILRDAAGHGFAWGDEALRLMVLWAAMLGAIAASRDDAHLRIDVLSRLLAPTTRLWIAAVVDLFTMIIAAILAWYSWKFVADSREFGDVLLGNLPAWPFQAIMPVTFVLMAWRYFLWTVRRVQQAMGSQSA